MFEVFVGDKPLLCFFSGTSKLDVSDSLSARTHRLRFGWLANDGHLSKSSRTSASAFAIWLSYKPALGLLTFVS